MTGCNRRTGGANLEYMPDDVQLVWWSQDDSAISATRDEVKRWIIELKLPGGYVSKGTLASGFGAACDGAKVEYEGPDGRHTVTGTLHAKAGAESITYSVRREDGLKLAEIKYFAPRRVESGRISGTHRIMDRLAHRISDADRLAARQWIKQAKAIFEHTESRVSWQTLRRMLTTAFEESCVPLLRKRATYFFGAPDLAAVERIGEFIGRCSPDPLFQIVPVASHADWGMFAASADALMAERADKLVSQLEGWTGSRSPARVARRTAVERFSGEYERLYERTTYYESWLGPDLTQTQQKLLIAKGMIETIAPPAGLPTVSGR